MMRRPAPRVELAFLWHMHQPPYRDPVTDEYILPWVRLHATRAYLDMAVIHERFPEVRGTVNFVPSLLDQLDDYACGRAKDKFLSLTTKRAEDLDPGERVFVLRNFFMVSWEQGVRPLPRYWELLHKRGRDLSKIDLEDVSRGFSNDDLRDLQVLFNLAWMGFAAQARYELVRALRDKGRGFTENEKLSLLEVQREIVSSITREWQLRQESGSVELSATAYYHPILPLLCDTEAALIAMPNLKLPPRLRAPEDAREQVRRARARFTAVFGREPVGMWPAEGSVSPEALSIFASDGVAWVASDEEVLLRSMPAGTNKADVLYQPWRVRAGDRDIAMVFRDRGLSDLLGFTYSKSPPREAVDDLIGHLTRIADASSRPGGEPPLVSIILDGENPWEQYPDSGLHFLTELFGRLARHDGGIATTTIGERISRMPRESSRIERIHSGSWIEANFRIWIGHEEDVAAWTLVEETKRAIEAMKAQGASAEAVARAYEHLLAAEGSDWFWWYGPDFVTENSAEFDALFRGHIQAAFRELGLPPPMRSLSPIAAGARSTAEALHEAPTGFVHPKLDGDGRSWIEWQGAGLFRLDRAKGGAMFRGGSSFSALRWGFDPENLYIRLDPSEDAESLSRKMSDFLVTLRTRAEELEVGFALTHGDMAARIGGREVGRGKFRDIVEFALPFLALGLSKGDPVAMSVKSLRSGVEVERIPAEGFITFEVPDENFERVMWKV